MWMRLSANIHALRDHKQILSTRAACLVRSEPDDEESEEECQASVVVGLNESDQLSFQFDLHSHP